MGEREKVLLVDDQPQVLEMLRKGLERDGHVIVANAKSLLDVVDVLQNTELDFTVAIVDGLGGEGAGVAEALRGVNPGVKIIAFSSYQQTFGDKFVEKTGDFRKAVREI